MPAVREVAFVLLIVEPRGSLANHATTRSARHNWRKLAKAEGARESHTASARLLNKNHVARYSSEVAVLEERKKQSLDWKKK